jgi:hypothetical protein
MTAAPDVLVDRLRVLTRLACTSLTDIEFASLAADQLSDELKRAGELLGLDAPLARRLLSLREELDSHALTASALAGCDVDDATALAMMRRGLDVVELGLPRRGDPLLVRVAVH